MYVYTENFEIEGCKNKPNRTKLAVQLTAKRAKFKHSSVVRTKLLLLGFTFTDDASSS